MGSRVFDMAQDPPAQLYKQLEGHGYCVISNAASDPLKDAGEVLAGWFSLPQTMKLATASCAAAEVAAGCGRGFFVLPDKEVLEVGAVWKPQGARADVRLAANAAYSELKLTACKVLSLLFCSAAGSGLQATTEQQASWVKQPTAGQAETAGPGSSSCWSMLHVSSYRPSSAAAAAAAGAAANTPGTVLRGCEAHVDMGLVTVIAATSPGLQVLGRDGSWVPVTSSQDQLVVLVGHTLSFATAGRLPAALHRVVVEPGSSSTGIGGAAAACSTASSRPPRMSLAFKLRAAGAVFSPAKITGEALANLTARYQVPRKACDLMAAFEATHVSVNSSYPLPPLLQQQGSRVLHSQAVAGAAAGKADTIRRGSTDTELERDSKRIKPDPDAVLTIVVRNRQGKEVAIKMKGDMLMSQVFAAYCKRCSIDEHAVRFIFDGERVHPFRTPGHYGMEDGDAIYCFEEETGD